MAKPLPLPAERRTPFSPITVSRPSGHFADELHRVRRLGGLNDVGPARSGEATIGDVRCDRVVEEHDILAYQRDVRAQAREPERRDVGRRRGGFARSRGRRSAAAGWRAWNLPAPEAPTSATVSPDSMENETRSTAGRELPDK